LAHFGEKGGGIVLFLFGAMGTLSSLSVHWTCFWNYLLFAANVSLLGYQTSFMMEMTQVMYPFRTSLVSFWVEPKRNLLGFTTIAFKEHVALLHTNKTILFSLAKLLKFLMT